jgi:hypothetical protein
MAGLENLGDLIRRDPCQPSAVGVPPRRPDRNQERSLTIPRSAGAAPHHRYAIIADGDGVPQAETIKSKRRLTACIRIAM